MNSKWKTLLFVSPIAVLLASCGGGGDTKQYLINADFPYCTIKGIEAGYAANDNVSFTVSPESGYVLPERIEDEEHFPVVEGIKRKEIDYKLDDITGVGTFNFKMPANNVGLQLDPIEESGFKFTFNGVACTANNEKYYGGGTSVSFTITADTKHALPDSKSDLTVEGVQDFTYIPDGTKQTATFSCTMPSNGVRVTVKASSIFSITGMDEGITFDSDEALEGNDYNGTIHLDSSTEVLPDTSDGLLSVLLPDKTDIKKFCRYTYSDPKTAGFYVPAKYVVGDIMVDLDLKDQPTTTQKLHFIPDDHCASIDVQEEYIVGEPVTFTIGITSEDYKLPTSPDDITVEGVTNFDYSVDDSGMATFHCDSMPNNEVTVRINTIEKAYNVKFILNHCSITEFIPHSKYDEGEDVAAAGIKAEEGYVLPASSDDITVVGVNDFEYDVDDPDEGTYYFTCTVETSDITITITATEE